VIPQTPETIVSAFGLSEIRPVEALPFDEIEIPREAIPIIDVQKLTPTFVEAHKAPKKSSARGGLELLLKVGITCCAGGQTFDEGILVETATSNKNDGTAGLERFGDRRFYVVEKVANRTGLIGVLKVEPAPLKIVAIGSHRFCGSDVQASVDCHSVDADDESLTKCSVLAQMFKEGRGFP
jgi:hypothetical protein